MSTASHHPVLIIGAGSGGVSVAARLQREPDAPSVTVVDPAGTHDYQPLWTLVGGGVRRKEVSRREMGAVIPEGVRWIRDAVGTFEPDANAVVTVTGERLTYDQLVVAPGIQIDWGAVPGLKEHIGRDGLCSNYAYETVDSTWESIRSFEGGTAVFTHPNTPIKCGGAPQKIMYLAADYWRRNPPARPYQVVLCIATPKLFAVERYARSLVKATERYGIEVRYQHDLTSIDAEAKRATFQQLSDGSEVTLDYAMMHVTPPMSAPDFVKASPLANGGGWVDVDAATLRHVRYPNVFSLGDASSLPTSKTAAAVRMQAPTLVENLMAARREAEPTARYDGYTSCPLVTGYGKLVMAEFDYDLKPQESFPIDQSQERLSMYLVKKQLLPRLYWDGMLKGRW